MLSMKYTDDFQHMQKLTIEQAQNIGRYHKETNLQDSKNVESSPHRYINVI